MTTSTHLTRIGRLLVLCGIVAGTAASVAVADVGVNVYGPRWQGVDQAYRNIEPASNVPTPQGLKADGLRWQGIAQVYRDLQPAENGPTAEGLKADGLRWQGVAQVYRSVSQTSGSSAAAPVGDRIVDDYFRDPAPIATPGARIVDDSFRDAARFTVRQPTGSGFDWGDWGIGLGAGFGLALCLAGALLLAHRIPRGRKTGAAAVG